MLVLTRRRNQSVVIGGTITVTVVDFDKETVRLAVPKVRDVRLGESLSLAPEITVIPIRLRDDDRVQLGINVPKGVSIHRQEIDDRLAGPETL